MTFSETLLVLRLGRMRWDDNLCIAACCMSSVDVAFVGNVAWDALELADARLEAKLLTVEELLTPRSYEPCCALGARL